MILFIYDDRRGRGHRMRCEAIREAIGVMGGENGALLRWPPSATEPRAVGPSPPFPVIDTVVLDTYEPWVPIVAKRWEATGAKVYVLEDFPGFRWREDRTIRPVGEYAIVSQEAVALKGTEKTQDVFDARALAVGKDRIPAAAFAHHLAISKLVKCYATTTAIDAAYLDCALDMFCRHPGEQATYDWLCTGDRPDGAGAYRIAERLLEGK